jgi:glycosyltransferase involved in cell wall biosynthesis
MRLAIIADTFPPLRISGAVQMRDLVRQFAEDGHEPTVIVPTPGLGQGWSLERDGRTTVLRVRTLPTKDVSYARRAIAEMLLPHMLIRALRKSGIAGTRWDGVIWYAPTIFLGPVVRWIRKRSDCGAYLILRDIFPEWAVDMGLMRRGPAYLFFKWVERRQYAQADCIGVQTPANLAYLERWMRSGDGRSLEVLQNWLSAAPVLPCRIDVSRTALRGRRIFVYSGNMGVAQGMDVFLDLAAVLKDRRDAGFIFVGRGSDAARFAARAERERLDNVLFHDEIEPSEIPGLLAQCHAGIVALDPRHKSHNIPGKFLTYMQAGLPVLARINPGNDLEGLIRNENVGRVCCGGDAATLRDLAEQVLDDRTLLNGVSGRAQALWRSLFSTQQAVQQIVRALSGRRRALQRAAETGDAPNASVLILNQYFHPDIAATAQHAFDLAKYLSDRGHRVTAIASRSIYGQAGGTLPSSERVDGIDVQRVSSSFFGKRGIASRTLDFAFFNIACLGKALTLRKHDVAICLTTPPFIALTGWILRAVKGTRFVFWTMDLYPDVPLAAGIIKRGSLVHRAFDRLDRFVLSKADRIVVLGRCMKARVSAKGVPESRIRQISPWSDPLEVRGIPVREIQGPASAPAIARALTTPDHPSTMPPNGFREEWSIGNRFVIEYSGNCGLGHDISSVCQAMLELKHDDSIRWVFVGGGVMRPQLEQFIAEHRITNVIMRPYQPRSSLGELIALGDVHLVLIADGFEGTLLPSKFYGVMAAARPAIYIGPERSEVAFVINEVQCGYSLRNGDGSGLVAAIKRLQREPEIALAMGLRGRHALEERYSMQRACAKWRECIRECLSDSR